MDLVILAGAIFYFGLVFDALAQSQRRVERQNRELIGSHLRPRWGRAGQGARGAVTKGAVPDGAAHEWCWRGPE
jgi:hypothetical protein